MDSLKSFFGDLGINLYEFKENDYFLVNLEELGKKVLDCKGFFPLLTSENCGHKTIPGGEWHPVFETKDKIYLLKEIKFKDEKFMINCQVADVNDEDDDHPEVISIENLRQIYGKG